MKMSATSWLVSYEYQEVYKTKLGISASHPRKTVELLTEHPAIYFAKIAVDYSALLADEYNVSVPPARIIRAIYSATEVPPNTITMADVLAYKLVSESE